MDKGELQYFKCLKRLEFLLSFKVYLAKWFPAIHLHIKSRMVLSGLGFLTYTVWLEYFCCLFVTFSFNCLIINLLVLTLSVLYKSPKSIFHWSFIYVWNSKHAISSICLVMQIMHFRDLKLKFFCCLIISFPFIFLFHY